MKQNCKELNDFRSYSCWTLEGDVEKISSELDCSTWRKVKLEHFAFVYVCLLKLSSKNALTGNLKNAGPIPLYTAVAVVRECYYVTVYSCCVCCFRHL